MNWKGGVAVLVLLLWMAFTWVWVGQSLVDTPTAAAGAPLQVEVKEAPTAAATGHCELLEDEATCYLLTYPGCNVRFEELGPDSWRAVLECDPVEAEE